MQTVRSGAARIRLLCACLAALCCVGFAGISLGTPPAFASATLPRASANQVTVIILDMSGSMAQNDPNGYRCSAANAYIDLSGPGQYIGLIGLDNNNASGPSGGPHNYRLAMKWSDPREMATVSQRQALKSVIQQQSHNCQPDGNTPTYDALNQAYTMLANTTQGGKHGSVIMLTDGVPDPDGASQIANIKSELLPKFKQQGWPIDTIALGVDASSNGIDFHGFLSDVSNATGGAFFDDGKGPVPGVSPLNLEAFFIDIFQLRSGRTPGPTIPPTPLNGATVSRNFNVGDFVSHLDVIAIKDQPNTSVTITAPNGQMISATGAGAFVATDPHYVIFSIDAPQAGPWQLNATGSGQFIMDSLVVSTLALTITSPAANAYAPLGQPVTLTAQLRDQGNGVVGQFQVKGLIEYKGNGTFNPLEIVLSDPNGTGDYTTQVTLPASAPAGSYQITLTAHSASEDAVAAQQVASFVLFPTPVLIDPASQQPTNNTIGAHVLHWDPALSFIYTLLPFYSSNLIGWHPSDWPLGGLAANSAALVTGEVVIGPIASGARYPHATVTGTATPSGSTKLIPVQIENDAPGYFRVMFPANAHGAYTLHLTATGNYHDSYGALTTATANVQVTVGIPSVWDEVRAWLITALYTIVLALVLIFGVYGPLNYAIRAKPSRRNRLMDPAINQRAMTRSQMDIGTPLLWHGWSLRRYFAPNRLPAGEVTLPDNLIFVHRRGNEVAIQVRKPRGKDTGPAWSIDGRQITPADGSETIVAHSRLTYSEGGQQQTRIFEQDGTAGDPNANSTQGGIRDRAQNLAGDLGVRDRFRRARGLRND